MFNPLRGLHKQARYLYRGCPPVAIGSVMFRNLKIGPKLVIIFLLISGIPLLLSSILSYSFTKIQLRQRTSATLQAVNDSRAAHIHHLIQLRQEQAKEVAGAAILRQLQESGVNDPGIIADIQDDIDSTFFDLKAAPASNYSHIDKKTDITSIGIFDVHGNMLANTDRQLIGQRLPFEYLQSIYKQRTYFRGLEKDPQTAEKYLSHFEEIRNWKSDLIVGAVELRTGANILDEILTARDGLGKSGETYLVDAQHRMITPSRFVKDAVLNQKVDTANVQACFQKKNSPVIYRNYLGYPVLGVSRYLADENWCLIAEIGTAEAFAPVRQLRNRTIILGLIMVALIVVLAYWASGMFNKPLLRLYGAAQEVARGNYDVNVPVDRTDEVGELTQAFNDMTGNLAAVTKELEKKNKALFQHLAVTTRQKKELKEVNQELDSFVYTASHDLRAPLRGIASFATFLEEDYKDKLDEQGKEYLNEIRKGATKMNELIEDLLLLSRISRIKNPYENVNMQELLDGVLERVKFDIQKNNVEVVRENILPTACCDRIKIAEVFYNLINNAIKFSSKNNKERPQIVVGYFSEAHYHKFFVRDNGIGIDPKYHQQVFGIFKRLHTDKEYEGTGAGLSIVKRVIDDHGGEISIESQVGQGATFFFTIPKDLQPGENTSAPEADSDNAKT